MTDKKCGCACICQPKYITIYKGFDTYFNGKHLIHISVEGIYAEREHSYKFIIGGVTKKYDNITDGFFVDLTAAETKTLDLGPQNGTIIAIDPDGHETPITTALPFIIENWVQGDINVEQNDITINVKDGDQNEIIINLKSPYFETILHNDLLDRDVENCHPVGAITGLQEALESKQDVIQDLDQIRAGAALGATSVQTVETGTANGTIAVDGNDVPVKGLGSAAFENTTAFDAAGSAAAAEQNAKNYADGLASNYATAAQGAKADTAVQTVATGSTSGTIAVDGVDVAVADLGSAAFTNSSDYATSEQGTLASSALQPTDVIDDLVSTDTDKPLSANMGKELKDMVDNVSGRGHYLALWNCATGLAQSNPPESPYVYKAGDYFIVGTVATGSANNYRPTGSSYTTGVASTVVETQAVDTDDVYYFDGTNWSLQINTQKEIGFGNIAGSPYDNTNLATALNTKLESTDLKTVNGTSLVGSGNIEIASNQLFDEDWTTNSTTAAFLEDVYADTSASIGMSYIGELQCSDLPASMGNAEATMEILPSSTAAPKVVHITLTSGTTDPYRWELSYYVIGATVHNSGWIAFQPKMTAGTGIAIASNAISAVAMTGADGTNAGTLGAVPAPAATDNTKLLKGDGTWYAPSLQDVASAGNGIKFSSSPVSQDYTIIGTGATVSDSGIASGFTSSSYVESSTLSQTSFTSAEVITMVNPTSFSGTMDIIGFSSQQSIPIGFPYGQGYLGIYTSAPWTVGSTLHTTGVNLWVKVVQTLGTSIKVYSLIDNGYTIDTLPDTSSWTLEATKEGGYGTLFSGTVRFGKAYATDEHFNGTIDLTKTAVYVDGSLVWRALNLDDKTTINADIASTLTASSTNTQSAGAKVVYDSLETKQATLVSGTNIKTINNQSLLGSGNIDIQGGGGGSSSLPDIATAGKNITFGYDYTQNFTVSGSPTITNGVVDNISASNYLMAPAILSANPTTFELTTVLKMGSSSVQYSAAFANSGPQLFKRNSSYFGFYTGTTDDICNAGISYGNTYWAKAVLTESSYTVYIYPYTEGNDPPESLSSWTNCGSTTNSTAINNEIKPFFTDVFRITGCNHPSYTSQYWNGTIDLMKTKLVADGVEVWTPYTATKTEINSGYYGTCSTSASTATKSVVCSGFVLKTGAKIDVAFTNSNTNAAASLDVNGTGAKLIKEYGTTAVVARMWVAGEVVSFVYDGTYWYCLKGARASTVNYGPTMLSNSMTSSSIALASTPNALYQTVYNMIAKYSFYSSSATYAVGDRVLRDFNAWECNTPITTAESWTEAHWTKLDPIQKQIDDKIGDIETLLAQV